VTGRTDFAALESTLGYTYVDRTRLEAALCHCSWANEHPRSRGTDNERLEFLGDAVLDLVVGHMLMDRFPDLHEGQLSITRAQVVSEAALAEEAVALKLGEWLRLGRGEDRSGGREKPKILADALEAVVASVYLDGGFHAAWQLVDRLLGRRIGAVEVTGFYDFKTRLQEDAQARLRTTPSYRVVAELGPDHDKRFEVVASVGTVDFGRAIGKSKKEAEQLAAQDAVFRLASADLATLAAAAGDPPPTPEEEAESERQRNR
jgi:ribonuclease-3